MVEHLNKELESRLEIEDMKEINREITNQLQQQEKYVKFHQWLKANGAKYDSIEYPVAFGKKGELIGIAAKRRIGPEESYIYIPNKLTINDEKILKSEIGFIIKNHKDVFQEHFDGEYLRLIFFICYELTKEEKSFWYPYFQVCQESDLPCFWDKADIDMLEDELLKAEINDYKEEFDSEYLALHEIASLYPDLIDITRFTEKKFKLAFTVTVTRCFGWSLPSTMIVPFADCANHFIIDNQYEMFNKQLHERKVIKKEQTFSQQEQTYFTPDKMRNDYFKHLTEDFVDKYELPYKTKRYIRKLVLRNKCLELTPEQFLKDPELIDQQIWDLKYISTSDEEDNDSSESDEESSDDSDVKEENKEDEDSESDEEEVKNKKQNNKEKNENLKIWKEDSENKNIPEIAKKLKPAKKKQRMYFAYTYNNKTGEGGNADPQKSIVVRKRVEARQPESLIDLLIMQKSQLYEKEQRMKLLKEQDEEEWQKMVDEYNSSEQDDDEENFAWYNDEDKETYFVLCTKHKNTYEVGQQVFHCYGRRTNRFLLLNYGFCLNNNKYNSLSFRVQVNFNWYEQRKKEQEKQQKEEVINQEQNEEEEENKISKIIRLKKNRINEEIFAYIRANLLNTYKGKNLEYLLISSPVDSEFEMLVIACTINLLSGLLQSRFKTKLEEDQQQLKDPNLNYRQRFAILHRMNAKEILNANINYCNILMRILARFDDGKQFKKSYMKIVEDFETEDQILHNRIKLRKYLRELVVNQKRILNAAKDENYMSNILKQMKIDEKVKEQEQKYETTTEDNALKSE